jgi:hypothetical protein
VLVLELPLVVAVEARPPVVPVAAGPSRVTTDVMMIGVGVSPLRVAEGVTVTIEVAISVVEGGCEDAVTTWVVTGAGVEAGAALEGAGAADDGAGAADEGSGAAEEAGGASEEAGGADDAGGAEDAGAAELGAGADEAGGAAEEGVLGAAEDWATEGVDGSGAADEGAGAADVGAADGVTGWVDTSSTVGEEGEEEGEEGATGAEEGETIEMNVLAAVSFADDMMKSTSHASPVDRSDKRQQQQSLSSHQGEGESEDLSASRVSAVLGSWFVPGGSRYAGAGPLLLLCGGDWRWDRYE